MSFREKNKSLIDTSSTVILATLALIFSLKIFPLAIFLFPIPFIVIGVNYGMKNSIIGLIISTIIIGIALDVYSGILMLTMFLPLIIGLVNMIKKDYKPSKILLIGTIIFVISILVIVFVTTKSLDVDFSEEANKVFQTNFTGQLKILKDAGLKKDEALQLEETLDIVRESILITMPSVFIILAIGLVYINYLISALVLRKDGYPLLYGPVFSEFKLPKSIFVGTMVMFIFSYIFSKLNILNGEGVIRNLVVLVTFLFSIQGLSLLDYLMIRRGMKLFGRMLMIIMLMFLLPIGSLMSFVGVLDVIFDFRKREKSN